MNFFKSFWKFVQNLQSFVGTLLFLILMIIIMGVVLVNVFSGSSDKEFDPETSALVLNFRGNLLEQEAISDDSIGQIIAGDLNANTILRDVVRAIDLAKDDDDISAIILDFEKFGASMPSKLHFLGEKITDFKESGKKVYAYGSMYTQPAYLLASYADEIYLHPYGGVLLYGYGGYQNYFQGFLEKIKAEVQLFKVGKYKSAMEPFTRSDMSEEAKEANLALYGGLWNQYISSISNQRGIGEDIIHQRIENADTLLQSLDGDIGRLALDNSLVDGLKTRAEWVEYMQSKVGKGRDEKGINYLGYQSYLAGKINMDQFEKKDTVAIVYVNGPIMDGAQPQGRAGGDTVSRLLRQARLDDNVKAIVLRVDTGGGSAFASELIRQEVLQTQKAGKPVVVSMGSVAASGGYWVSANADEIWAAPTTITGSIGIFGAIPNFEGTFAEIGITTDGVGTTQLMPAGVSKPLPEKLKNIIQSNIENGYERFLKLVSEGRDMPVEQVDEIAQGRVWTGVKALELGLVDKLGNIEDAIKSAADLAKLDEFKVIHWEDELPFEMQLINKILKQEGKLEIAFQQFENSPEKILAKKIMNKLSFFTTMNDPHHAYAICTECSGMMEAPSF